MNLEETVMELIANSGDAKSTAIEALRYSRDGNFEKAEEGIKFANKILLEAHKIQTQLIQKELNGEKIETSLLIIHAQDHLMNSVTVIDLVKEMIEILHVQERNKTK